MNRSILNTLRAVVWLSLWIVPIPFGAFASDRIFFVSVSTVIFLAASVLMPPLLRRRDLRLRGESAFPAVPYLLYGGITGAVSATAALGGMRAFAFWQSYPARTGAYAAWLFGTIALQYGLSLFFARWHTRVRERALSDFIDPVLYALPLPTAFMALFFFPAVRIDAAGQEQFITGLIGLFFFVNTGLYFTFIIGTFAFYFYPRPEGRSGAGERIWGLLRVILLVCVFFYVQASFNSVTGLYAYELQYLTARNNPLSFVLPFITYALFMCVSVGMVDGIGLIKDKLAKK